MPSTVGNVIALAGGTVNLQSSVYFNGLNLLSSQPGGTVQLSGSLLGNTRNLGQFTPLGTLIMNGSGTQASPQLLEVMGQDFGTSQLGFIHNFNYGTLTLANNTYVKLIDQYDNASGTGSEALYVNSLIVPVGCTLDLNGLHLYARSTQIGGTILHGTVTQIPNSGPIGFDNPTLGNIATAGQLDEWTFFARAGQFYTVLVDPGSGSGVPPYLNFVEAKVVDTNGVVLATGTNATSGTALLLSSIAITNDGTYRVQVHASPASPSSTGHYMVTIWQTTPNVAALTMNEIVSGSIETPYSVDQWTFGANVNDQVRFHLVSLSGPGVGFDLQGPNGWRGFTNLVADSDFITLPAAGSYSVLAHSLNGQYGVNYAFELFSIAITNLALGTPYQGQCTVTGQGQLFQFILPASAPLQIVLNNLVAGNHYEIYAKLGAPPTRSIYDYHAAVTGVPGQQLLIPMAAPGTWYVLVYADNIQTPGAYTVTASSASVLLFSVTPNHSGRNAPITVTLTGAGFDSSSSVQFIDGASNVYPATTTSVDSFTQITATEAASTLPPGTYSVRVSLGSGTSATLMNAFQVLSVGAPVFASSVVAPSQIGYHVPATIYPEYSNTGDAAMPAPLLVLTALQNGNQGAFLTMDATLVKQGLWTSAEPAGFYHTVQFLGCGQTPGVLQPGETFRVPIYYAGWQQPWDFSYTPINWNLGVVKADDPTPVDWSSLEAGMKPSTIAADAWHAIFTAFTAQAGTTWGGYVTMLDNNASYLGRVGLNVVDISKLLGFQFMQADGLCPLRTLASSVDASVAAPGLPLTFSRSFGEPISQRYSLGPLGRGWSHNWQYSLQQSSDGTVTIFGPGGAQRMFQPDTRGGYFAQPGDYGTLAPAGGGAFTLTEKSGVLYFYRSDGKLSYVEDLNQNRITLGYTGSLLTSLMHSSGQSIQIAYNGAGRIQTLTDNLNQQTVLSYDAGNEYLICSQYSDGRTATYTYNTTGTPGQLHALTGVASSCCNWRYFSYDPLGRLVGTYLGGNAEALTFTYDIGGKVTVTDGIGNATKFYYDHRGLLAKTEDALGNAVHLAFDDSYNLVSIMDPTGRSYNYAYDDKGNVTRSTDPMGHNSQFGFTSDYNRLALVKDAKGNPTKYDYDPYGNVQSITYADNSVEEWSYDYQGNPQTWQNRRGHETFYTCDNSGRVTGKYFADGSATEYTYDTRGNLTNSTTYDTILNPLESVSMTYDASNRLARMDYPGGKYLTFSYDSAGRRTSSLDQLGHRLDYYYDVAGRLQSMTNELNALVVLYDYDPAGRIARKTVGNGMFTTHQYDPTGQLLKLTNSLANDTVISRFNYSYDSRGRRSSMDTLDGHWTYDYDDIGQLTHAVFASTTTNIPNQDFTYVYDVMGNRTQTIENGVTNSYTINNLNQYVTVGTTHYTFDADGNLIREASPQGTNTYTYNDDNQLIAVSTPQGNWGYAYDGMGSRVAKTENESMTRYVIDPVGLGNVVGEYDAVGGFLARYDHSSELVSRTDVGGNATFYTFDAIGNAQQLVTAAGVVVNSYTHAPFGTPLKRVETVPNPFQFNGQLGVVQEDNGFVFMRNRSYSPSLGRFTSPDPLGLGGGEINLYTLANDPISETDPSGLGWDEFIKCSANDVGKRIVSLIGSQIAKRAVTKVERMTELRIVFKQFGKLLGRTLLPKLLPLVTVYDISMAFLDGVDIGIGCYGSLIMDDSPRPSWETEPDLCYAYHMCMTNSGPTTPVTRPTDPNQLTGPAGFGTSGFLSSDNAFAYRIDFENTTNATAPAQQVVIADQLSTNFDWSTFNVSEFGFGDMLFALPPGIQHFETNVLVSYLGTNFQVQIQIGINLVSGQVYANFHSIDPNTSLPPPVNIGFLPPEDGTGRGQGHVTYTIRVKDGLPNGTQFRNVALISFDNQPAISTDQVDPNNPAAGTDPAKQCLITIDAVAPTSHVLPLPAQSQLLQFPISWTGTDDSGGSGVASYDIYVSDNGGSWTLWESATTSTNASFRGLPQHTYGFYSTAHDNAGNIEQPYLTADATTTIVANPQFHLTVTPASTNLNNNATFSYTITVKNVGSLNLNNVTMSNAMPAGISLDWVQYGRGSCDIGDSSIIWSLGNMNTNVSAAMNVTADSVANGTWTNFFSVADSDGAAAANAIQVLSIGVASPVVLNITLTNYQVLLSWPVVPDGFALETTSNLVLQSSWLAVTNTPVVVGDQKTVTADITGSSKFYRLRKP
ncbi:MAG TPA: RHS repeat-associated core domain-containing protein [Candidatus Limnocylindrales bacterium]|nr:RHS repeat-associated core domain-containing protein [Candidatus Limnocylindrales bacterium]